MISVILPTFNEEKNSFFLENLKLLSKIKDIEVIAVDSKSHDSTLEILAAYKIEVLSIAEQTRAARLQSGINKAIGSKILLVHPRNHLSIELFDYLKNTENEECWGGFTHKFDRKHFFLNYISWYSNNIRVKRKSIVYLDHCIFLHKNLKKYISLPSIPIFEDTVLSQQLKKIKKAELINLITVTSAIRFEKAGIYKQYLKNQLMKLGFALGISCHTLNMLYEKKLMLNTRYDK